MRRLTWLAILCCAAAARADDDKHGGKAHDPTGDTYDEPAEVYARRFDDPRRDAWQKPAHVVELLDVRPGMTVVDLGSAAAARTARVQPSLHTRTNIEVLRDFGAATIALDEDAGGATIAVTPAAGFVR